MSSQLTSDEFDTVQKRLDEALRDRVPPGSGGAYQAGFADGAYMALRELSDGDYVVITTYNTGHERAERLDG